jgi:hypothetical protein
MVHVVGEVGAVGAGLGAPVDRGQGRRLRRGPQRRGGRTSMVAAPMVDRKGVHGAAAADWGEGVGSTWRRRQTGGRAHGAAADFGDEVGWV